MIRALSACLRSFGHDKTGAVAVLWMLSMPMLIAAGAVAVDFGSLYLDRRELQVAADAAALAAVQQPSRADASAREIFVRNGYPEADFDLSFGTYVEDPTRHRDDRFIVDPSGADVRIDARDVSRASFVNFLRGELFEVSVRSEAAHRATVSLSAGSRLAALDGGIANQALSRLLGSDVKLTLADYNGLAGAKVSLGSLLGQLVPTGTATATVATVLDRTIDAKVLVGALASSLAAEGNSSQATILRRLIASPSSVGATLKPGELIAVDDGLRLIDLRTPSRALAADVSVLSVLQAAIASLGDGTQIELKGSAPGLLSADTQLILGQGMQKSQAAGWIGTTVETGQVRLRSKLETEGVVSLLGLRLTVPLEVIAAGGSATIVDAVCSPDPNNRTVTVDVRPGLARLEIGRFVRSRLADIAMDDTLSAARIVDLPRPLLVPGAKVDVHSRIRVQDDRPQRLVFRGAEIGNGSVKTVSTSRPMGTLLMSLFSGADIQVEVLGVGLGIAPLRTAVAAVLSPLAVPVGILLDETLRLGGVRLGEMDVRVDGMSCGGVRLIG